jgi:putative ABC transport system permease protein
VRAGGLLRLALKNLAADRTGALLDGAASAVGAAALVFFVALGLGVGDAARRMFPGDARLIEVVPPAVSLGAVLGGGRLDDEAVARLRGLPGAADAFPKLNLRVPLAAMRAPEGLEVNWPPALVVQIPAVGVPRALVAGALAPGTSFEDPPPGGAVPVVLSGRLVEIYNRTIAASWNVRRLPPPAALVGLQLPVRVGFSMVPQKTEDRVVDGRLLLAGFSDRVPLYAAALPIETVRRLHREYRKPDQGYSAVALLAARPDDVPTLSAAVRRMGLAVEEGERGGAERVGTAVAVTTGALALLALLMCALAALAIAQSLVASVRARAKDLAVLVALGARARDVRRLLVLEASLIGLAGGVLGAALARLSAVGADGALQRALPDFPLKPETLFTFPPWVYLLGVAVAVLSAALGALAPAAAAARIEPARVLS